MAPDLANLNFHIRNIPRTCCCDIKRSDTISTCICIFYIDRKIGLMWRASDPSVGPGVCGALRKMRNNRQYRSFVVGWIYFISVMPVVYTGHSISSHPGKNKVP